MISTGNDIVDLSSVDPQRSVEFRFYSKFVTPSEQDYYNSISGKLSYLNYIWLLWSVKEAAYKYYQRNNPEALFSPVKVIVQLSNTPLKFLEDSEFYDLSPAFVNDVFFKGIANIGSTELHFLSLIQTNFVSTIVSREFDFRNVYWGIETIQSTDQVSQSRSVRDLAIKKLNELFPGDDFNVTKSKIGYPVVLRNGLESDILLSFAHHKRFVSYSCKLA